MTNNIQSKLFCLIILVVLMTNTAWANLMLAPQRVVFEERQRSASVHLVNTSNSTTTYRLHWVQKKQAENGKYIDLPDNSDEVPNASRMLRFSPRQVTLAPNERQTVRIALRRKKGLTEGEYRSHLLFQALPKEDGDLEPASRGAKIKINLLLGFSIPVIVRQGKPDVQVKISDVELRKQKIKNKTHYGAYITLRRSGLHTAYGSLRVIWKSNRHSGQKEIAILNNVSFYPDSEKVKFFAGFKDFKPGPGQIKVEYVGAEKYDGHTFDAIKTAANHSSFKLETIMAAQ